MKPSNIRLSDVYVATPPRRAVLAEQRLPDAIPPERDEDPGYLLRVASEETVPKVGTGTVAWIRTGYALALPIGYIGLLVPTQEMAVSRGLMVVYPWVGERERGEIIVPMVSWLDFQVVSKHEVFARLFLVPCLRSGIRCVPSLPVR